MTNQKLTQLVDATEIAADDLLEGSSRKVAAAELIVGLVDVLGTL
jgi:hypothetical protein